MSARCPLTVTDPSLDAPYRFYKSADSVDETTENLVAIDLISDPSWEAEIDRERAGEVDAPLRSRHIQLRRGEGGK